MQYSHLAVLIVGKTKEILVSELLTEKIYEQSFEHGPPGSICMRPGKQHLGIEKTG